MNNSGLPTHRRYDAERRGSSRHEVSTPARLIHDDGAFDGEIEDLSAGGASFSTRETEPELADGAAVVLSACVMTPEGERRIERRARVVRLDDFFDGEHDAMTYAVEFDEPLTDSCFDDEV
jgi:hypothetical protein